MSEHRHEPRLTPMEAHFDQLLRFENAERASAQSADTRDGERAELPPRDRLQARLYALDAMRDAAPSDALQREDDAAWGAFVAQTNRADR